MAWSLNLKLTAPAQAKLSLCCIQKNAFWMIEHFCLGVLWVTHLAPGPVLGILALVGHAMAVGNVDRGDRGLRRGVPALQACARLRLVRTAIGPLRRALGLDSQARLLRLRRRLSLGQPLPYMP